MSQKSTNGLMDGEANVNAFVAWEAEVTDERRFVAAVEKCVYRRFGLGDTYVPLPDLIDGIPRLLKNELH